MAATLKDVSALANVDIGSVSCTLRNHPKALSLKPETRRRILAAARELGYRRNELAATMRTGLNRSVAVICRFDGSRITDFSNMVIAGILLEATRLNQEIKLLSDHDLADGFARMLGGQVRHVLSMSTEKDKREETAALCRKHKLKLVYIYERPHGEFPAVATDNASAAREAVRHLAGVGHRRIAMICGPHRFSYVNEHHEGYLRGLADAGLEPRDELIACGEELAPRERAIERMLHMPPESRPTAFYCIGDSLAMLVQRAAFRRGLKVPGDVSMMGYGNSELGDVALSPLTTVEQPFGLMGETALRLLLGERVDVEPMEGGHFALPTRIVVRESVAPPAREATGARASRNKELVV